MRLKENTAFSVLADVELGKRHGVFVTNKEKILKKRYKRNRRSIKKKKSCE